MTVLVEEIDVTGSLLLVSGEALDLLMGGGSCRWPSVALPFLIFIFYGLIVVGLRPQIHSHV